MKKKRECDPDDGEWVELSYWDVIVLDDDTDVATSSERSAASALAEAGLFHRTARQKWEDLNPKVHARVYDKNGQMMEIRWVHNRAQLAVWNEEKGMESFVKKKNNGSYWIKNMNATCTATPPVNKLA